MQSRKRLTLILFALLIGLGAGGCQGGKKTARPTLTPLPITEPTETTAPPPAPATSAPAPTKPAQPEATVEATTPPAEAPSPTPPPARDTSDLSPAVAQLAAQLQGLSLEDFFEVSWRELRLRNSEWVLEDGLSETYGAQEAKLTDISDAYVRETYQMYALVLDLLRQYDRDALTPEEQISYDVYEWYLDDRVRERAFMYYDYPATYFPVTAVHEALITFFTDLHPIADQQDAQDYITRLGQVDTKFEQLLEGLKLREEAGIVPPKFAIQWALYGNLRNLVNVSATATPFYRAFQEKVNELDISQDEKQRLLQEAEGAIDEAVLPAYQDLADYLAHLESVAPDDEGLWQFPQGEEYYAYVLRHHNTTNLSADDIHQLGLEELDRIHAEMRAVFDELGYPQDESLAQLFDRVAQDGGHVSGNQVLETYETLIAQAEQNLDAVFDIRPQAKVIVVGHDYGGYYISASLDGSRPGAFYAAVGGSGEDYYGMPTLAYHEAIPGHHWQIAIAQEADLPSFRKHILFTGYAEGWALYAEHLAWELGWYEDDPYGNLGRLQGEAFRAARLVVDTGIHTQGWSFDQAQDFFEENTGYEVGDIVNPQHEIARYTVWPGQSTAYKIGMIKMLELRQRAMDQLGDRFDLVEFHRVVLENGSMPLEILEQVVDQYIQAKLTQSAVPPAESTPSDEPAGLIAFYSHRDGNVEIYTMKPDGSDQRRLTFNEYDDYSPAWSPDGSKIAFLSDRDDPNPTACAPECFYQIYVIDADRSGEHKLIETEFATQHPDWHPDGTKLSFDSEFNLQGDIYVVNADGSGLQRLIEDGFWADWSPDGSQIVFASKRDGNVELYLADADGSNQRRLTDNSRLDFFPAWSPDGQRIAFATMEQKQIFVINADGGDEQQLTHQGRSENPTWSPDGTHIAFQSSSEGDFEIYSLNVEAALQASQGADAQRLTDNQAGDLWPAWGPAAPQQSGSILFEQSAQIFPPAPTWKIGLADLDGDGDLDAVFANGQANDSQVWLNDGGGLFTDTGQQLGQYGHGIDVGDLDGDGDPDLVISTHRDSAPSRVYLNDGNGVFQELEEAFDTNIGFSVDLFDLDGDGDLDAVGEDTDATNVYLNDGAGAFSPSPMTLPLTTVWGDLDGDGDVDALVKQDGVGYSTHLNDGGAQGGTPGSFNQHWSQTDTTAMDIGDMALGDVDDDGDLDVIATNGHHASSAAHPALVLINDGTGQFTDSGQRLSPVQNAGVSLGDLDGDGDLDLALTDFEKPCQIWLNDGDGQFIDSGLRLGDKQFYRHAHLVDLDGDGDLDIFMAAFGMGNNPNEIWFNQGQ